MTEQSAFPDIEIYLYKTTTAQILDWLSDRFGVLEKPESAGTVVRTNAMFQGISIPIRITPHAAGKNFTCVTLESAETPWSTDLDCARAAQQFLRAEVRCSASGWTEQEGEHSANRWWKLTSEGERKITWDN